MDHYIFNRRNEVLRLPLTKAVFYEAYGNYCYGVFPNKQKVTLPIGLAQLNVLLAERKEEGVSPFIRIGRRFIVNSEFIVQVNFEQMKLILSDLDHPGNFALPVSKESLKQIKELYNNKEIW